jgi:hypothetical protein
MDISAMYPARKIEKITRILVAGLIFWALPGMSLQANDDYLSILEAEAGNTNGKSAMSTAPVRSSPVWISGASKKNWAVIIQAVILCMRSFQKETGNGFIVHIRKITGFQLFERESSSCCLQADSSCQIPATREYQ